MSDFDREIFVMAWKYWNENVMPPQEYITRVAEFIRDNPDLFEGASPQ